MYIATYICFIQSLMSPWMHNGNPADLLQVNHNIQRLKVRSTCKDGANTFIVFIVHIVTKGYFACYFGSYSTEH